MPTLKRYPKSNTRTLIDFDNVLELVNGGEYVLLCASKAVVAVARKLLRDRGLWLATYASANSEVGYEAPTETEFTPVRTAISGFLEETNEMNCQDFLSALQDIASAIRSSGACANNCGPGYVSDGDDGVWYGTQEPLDKPSSFGGEGEFETEAAFQEHLCLAANNIVAGLILSCNNWAVMSLASLIAGAIIIAVFVAAPGVGAFIALGVAGFLFGGFYEIANYIDDNRQEWVCAIYNAASYSEMLVAIDALISDMVVTLDIGLFEVNITDIIHQALSTDVFNQAYQVVGLPAVIDAVPCDDCAPADCPAGMTVSVGTLDSLVDNEDGTWTMTVTSEYVAGSDQEFVEILSDYDETGCTFNFLSVTKTSGPVCNRQGRYYRPDDTNNTLPVWVSEYDPDPDIGPIKILQLWQSGTCSPGTSIYEVIISFGEL